jgi:hypothetical protein
MFRRISVLASVAAVALLVGAVPGEAALRHLRNKTPAAPKGTKLPPEVLKVIEREFPKAKVTGFFIEEKGELEVLVTPPGSSLIEVVFFKKGKGAWRLAGFEFPVPAAALTPRAAAELKAKHPKGKIVEVELIFNPSWAFQGYQVAIREGSTTQEVFVTANGTIAKDPL